MNPTTGKTCKDCIHWRPMANPKIGQCFAVPPEPVFTTRKVDQRILQVMGVTTQGNQDEVVQVAMARRQTAENTDACDEPMFQDRHGATLEERIAIGVLNQPLREYVHNGVKS